MQGNPVNFEGEKNVFCPFYRECLYYADEKSWEVFSCGRDCPHRKAEVRSEIFNSADSFTPRQFRLPGGFNIEEIN